MLDEESVRRWLTREEARRFRGALHTAAGRTALRAHLELPAVAPVTAPTAFVCPELPRAALGAIEPVRRPGAEAEGEGDAAVLAATSPMALACLQYLLDDARSGVRLILDTNR